jgi:predicted dehydrogenase
MSRLRVALVGLGSIGRRHLRLLLERPDISPEVMETSPEALAAAQRDFGPLPAHASFSTMLATGPDVVWLATPTPLHAEQTIAAMAAGAHVFCEKPMSDNAASARRMKDAADRSRTVLNIGFYLHFWEGMRRLKRLIESGCLGRVLHAHARVGSFTTLVNSASRYQASQPGSLFFDYSHQPDLFYWLLGSVPSSVWVAGLQGGNLELSSAPNVTDIVCRYKEDLITTVHLNYVQLPERHEYEVVGDLGWAQVDFFGGWIRRGDRRDGSLCVENFDQPRDDIFRAEHAAFFETIAARRPPETSAAAGLVSTTICAAAVESWRTGRAVTLDLQNG